MPHHSLLDMLAEVIHERWRQTVRQTGETNANDVPFRELSVEMRESNRAAARRITEVLAVAGLGADEGMASADEEAAARTRIEARLELLAEAEHRQWMAGKLRADWRFGPARDDARKVHDCLVPYSELRETDKEKNRVQVRGYPDWVRMLGWRLVTEDEKGAGRD